MQRPLRERRKHRDARSAGLGARLVRVLRVFNRLLDGLAADQRRLREVAARAFRAQESERVRMAHELEGETAQSLSALLLRLRVARRATEPAARDRLLDALRDEI